MGLATSRVTQPAKRKGRESCANSPRPFLNTDNNSNTADSITAFRRQRLAVFGLSDVRADLVASLAWGALV